MDYRRGAPRILDRYSYVPHYLTVLATGLTADQQRLYADGLGIGFNESRIVSILVAEAMSAVDISRVLDMHKSIVSRCLRTMLEKGWIERADTPRRKFRLTESGIERNERIVDTALARQALLLEGFTPNEKTIVLGYLARMYANLGSVRAFRREESGGPGPSIEQG
jgi:DNA-binding MarR family transcriptional regulator